MDIVDIALLQNTDIFRLGNDPAVQTAIEKMEEAPAELSFPSKFWPFLTQPLKDSDKDDFARLKKLLPHP
jgi:hypothetical protein